MEMKKKIDETIIKLCDHLQESMDWPVRNDGEIAKMTQSLAELLKARDCADEQQKEMDDLLLTVCKRLKGKESRKVAIQYLAKRMQYDIEMLEKIWNEMFTEERRESEEEKWRLFVEITCEHDW